MSVEEITYKLHYHSKEINLMGQIFPQVSVTAVVIQHGNKAVMNFGFSRLKHGDTFSRKYGNELTTLRAEIDPTLIFGGNAKSIRDLFLSIAMYMSKEVAFYTQLGKSLLSEVKLPEKKKVKWTEEMIQQARQQALTSDNLIIK